MLFGHLALAGIARHTLFKNKRFSFLALAAFGPDLVDKPLALACTLCGRGIGHSLLFFCCLLAGAWPYCSRKNIPRGFLAAGALLWLSHLGADFIDRRVAFWPLYGPLPEENRLGFWENLDRWLHCYRSWYWSNPQFCLECAFILLALFLWIRSKTYAGASLAFKQEEQ